MTVSEPYAGAYFTEKPAGFQSEQAFTYLPRVINFFGKVAFEANLQCFTKQKS